MSNNKANCPECLRFIRVSPKGNFYVHDNFDVECATSRKPVESATDTGVSARYTTEWVMKEFTPSEKPVKTGYTPEDLHEMLDGLTPKRKKFRQRLAARWHSFKKNLDNYFNGAWDVFDDE